MRILCWSTEVRLRIADCWLVLVAVLEMGGGSEPGSSGMSGVGWEAEEVLLAVVPVLLALVEVRERLRWGWVVEEGVAE